MSTILAYKNDISITITLSNYFYHWNIIGCHNSLICIVYHNSLRVMNYFFMQGQN
jgi:hypothetical protein